MTIILVSIRIKLCSYYHYSVENYELWDCARCISTSGYHYCRSDEHPNGSCVSNVFDGFTRPCDYRPSTVPSMTIKRHSTGHVNAETILTCGKKILLT